MIPTHDASRLATERARAYQDRAAHRRLVRQLRLTTDRRSPPATWSVTTARIRAALVPRRRPTIRTSEPELDYCCCSA
ncbi:MAG: hypothetical protein R8G01_12350 [Ilumatobacteraceae bacterium]|nr:hypothetical protein [Ilumatobacteraceae bacterium]